VVGGVGGGGGGGGGSTLRPYGRLKRRPAANVVLVYSIQRGGRGGGRILRSRCAIVLQQSIVQAMQVKGGNTGGLTPT